MASLQRWRAFYGLPSLNMAFVTAPNRAADAAAQAAGEICDELGAVTRCTVLLCQKANGRHDLAYFWGDGPRRTQSSPTCSCFCSNYCKQSPCFHTFHLLCHHNVHPPHLHNSHLPNLHIFHVVTIRNISLFTLQVLHLFSHLTCFTRAALVCCTNESYHNICMHGSRVGAVVQWDSD